MHCTAPTKMFVLLSHKHLTTFFLRSADDRRMEISYSNRSDEDRTATLYTQPSEEQAEQKEGEIELLRDHASHISH